MTPPPVTVTTATPAPPPRHPQSLPVLASPTGTLRRPANDPSAEFADVVAGSIDGPVLRYSQRLVLLKDAERRGIGRFEANLIIAAVLHREGMGQEYELPPIASRMGWLAPVLTFVAVQSAILI